MKAKQTDYQRLKIFLEENKLKQTTIAELFDITPQSVNAMLKGRMKITLHHAKILETTYNLNSQWLLAGVGSMLGHVTTGFNEKEYYKLQEENNSLKKDLEMFKLMCARLMGIEPEKVSKPNFNTGLLLANKNNAVQLALPLFELTQLSLLANPENAKVA